MKRLPKKKPMVLSSLVTINIGQQAQIPLHPSNLLITQLKIDKNRKAILEKKKRVAKKKDKHGEGLAGVD